jgi:hypothetical protein
LSIALIVAEISHVEVLLLLLIELCMTWVCARCGKVFYPRRVQFWNATRSRRAPLGREGVKLERDTFQSGILE